MQTHNVLYKQQPKDLKLDANAQSIAVSEKQRSIQLRQLKAEIEDPSLPYPAYYLCKFHGYDGGNLDWQAACELESATASLALRIIKKNRPPPSVAADMMRNSFLDTTQVMHMYDTCGLQCCLSCKLDSSGNLASCLPTALWPSTSLLDFLLIAFLPSQASTHQVTAFPSSPAPPLSPASPVPSNIPFLLAAFW